MKMKIIIKDRKEGLKTKQNKTKQKTTKNEKRKIKEKPGP